MKTALHSLFHVALFAAAAAIGKLKFGEPMYWGLIVVLLLAYLNGLIAGSDE
jgi:hypothetical protein